MRYLWILLCLSLTQCTTSAPEQDETPPTTTAQDTTPTPKPAEEPSTYYASVDNLRIRELPKLSAKTVTTVKEGAVLEYMGEVSDEKITLELRGETKTEPFIKIKTTKGKVGWVYKGAVSDQPVEVVPYRAAIGYRHLEEGEEDISGDWGYYASEAVEALKHTNIYFAFPLDQTELENVLIRDQKGTVIGAENVKALFDENGAGFVLIERGKKPGFVPYDMEMAGSIRAYFFPDEGEDDLEEE